MTLQTTVPEKKNVAKIGPGIAPSEAVALIPRLLDEHPAWNRTRLSRELCRRWNWRRPDGLLKDMTCRDLLLKLERAADEDGDEDNYRPQHVAGRSVRSDSQSLALVGLAREAASTTWLSPECGSFIKMRRPLGARR